LISLLALNGLRISEALSADIIAMGSERGHRTLTVLRKGGKIVTIPLAPRTARSLDLAIAERVEGADLPRCRRPTHGPPLRRVDRAPGGSPRRAGQEDQPA
jgi:integrase